MSAVLLSKAYRGKEPLGVQHGVIRSHDAGESKQILPSSQSRIFSSSEQTVFDHNFSFPLTIFSL